MFSNLQMSSCCMFYQFKLDDKEITTREFWKRQLIISSRQKRPASFGFYSPAICDDTGEGPNIRRRVCYFYRYLGPALFPVHRVE